MLLKCIHDNAWAQKWCKFQFFYSYNASLISHLSFRISAWSTWNKRNEWWVNMNVKSSWNPFNLYISIIWHFNFLPLNVTIHQYKVQTSVQLHHHASELSLDPGDGGSVSLVQLRSVRRFCMFPASRERRAACDWADGSPPCLSSRVTRKLM